MADPDEALLGKPIQKWGRWYCYDRNDAGRIVLVPTAAPKPEPTPHCWCGAVVVARQKSVPGDVHYLARCSADPNHVWHLEPGTLFSDLQNVEA